jgi:hypothetical protein
MACPTGFSTTLAADYIIIHRIDADDVLLILHVAHGSRDIWAFFGH